MVELLLDHGANVNAVDNDGNTALHISLKMEKIQRCMGLKVNKFTKLNQLSFFCLLARKDKYRKVLMK